WAALTADRFQWVDGSFAWREAFFPEVSVTTKGYVGSARDLTQKTAWRLDLNDYAAHDVGGLTRMTLNNMVQDPRYVHEDPASRRSSTRSPSHPTTRASPTSTRSSTSTNSWRTWPWKPWRCTGTVTPRPTTTACTTTRRRAGSRSSPGGRIRRGPRPTTRRTP